MYKSIFTQQQNHTTGFKRETSGIALIRCERERAFQNEELAEAQRQEKGWGVVRGKQGVGHFCNSLYLQECSGAQKLRKDVARMWSFLEAFVNL